MSEARLLSLVEQLSKGFTTARDDLKAYGLSSEQVSAYAYFYFPTNVPALAYVLDRLPATIREKLKLSTLIDWGTGPGTYLIAWSRYFSQTGHQLIGIDQSPLMLQQAQLLWASFGTPGHTARFERPDHNFSSTNITLCFGNSMNEMGWEKALEVIQKVMPNFIIFIEPGTQAVFKEMLNLRGELASLGWKNYFPCPDSSHSCPMDQASSSDWCHQIMLTTHDPSIERLSQKLHLDRRTRPLLAHVYGKEQIISNHGVTEIRVVRSFPPTKASYRFTGCRKEADQLENVEIEFLMRDTDSTMRKKLDKIRSGDLLRFEVKEQMTPQKYRAKKLIE